MAPLAPRVIVWNEDAGREEGLEAEALVATCPSSLPHADQITTLGFVRGASQFMQSVEDICPQLPS